MTIKASAQSSPKKTISPLFCNVPKASNHIHLKLWLACALFYFSDNTYIPFLYYVETLLRESLSSKHHKTTCEIKLKITGREEDVLNAKAILESKDKEISTKDTLDMQELPPEQMRKHQIGDEAAYTQEKVRYQGASRPKQRKSVFKRNFSWSKDVKNLEIYENGNLVIKVYEADILKVPTEGIVNAANEDLRHIGGIAGAIAKHAGKKLEEESRNIVKEEGKFSFFAVKP
jgi:hypothetical protein